MSEKETEQESPAQALRGKSKELKDGPLTIPLSELNAVVTAAVENAIAQTRAQMAQSQEQSAKVIAAALIESKKPFVSEEQKKNDEAARQSMVEIAKREKAAMAASQKICQHFQGCNPLSDEWGTKSSIVMHQFDTGEIVGICTNCLREWHPGDSDYMKEMGRKSGNRISRAGQRNFMHAVRATA